MLSIFCASLIHSPVYSPSPMLVHVSMHNVHDHCAGMITNVVNGNNLSIY